MTKDLENKFLEQLSTDKKFQEDLGKSKTPEEAHSVVVQAGYNVELAEFSEAMDRLNAFINQQSGELSENDLEMVAGGRSTAGWVYGGIGAAAGAVGLGAVGAGVGGAVLAAGITGAASAASA